MWSTRAALVLAGVLLGACGPTIPKELVNARNAYSEMQAGPARTTVPMQAQRAREALRTAERSYEVEGASDRTRELASAAERAAMQAQAACAISQHVPVQPPPAPVAERTRVQERLREVLTAVPGTVFFEFDKSELRPEAKERLDQLAEALTEAKSKEEGQTLVVFGHADSKGSEDYNMKLSERRAQSVREYLSSKGYDQNLIQVKAMGEEHPFATNKTVEGRADNRRVEIQLGEKKEGE